jgi:hypothetical protein
MPKQTKAQKSIANRARTQKATAARAADPSLIVVRLPANVTPELGKWWAGLKPTQRGEMIDRAFRNPSEVELVEIRGTIENLL